MVVEGRLVWRLGVQVPVAGPSGLLKRLVSLGVLVDVGVSLGVSTGEDSFGVYWTITNNIFFRFLETTQTQEKRHFCIMLVQLWYK